MNETAASARYRIHVRGVLSHSLLGAFPGLAAHTNGRDTVLEGTLLDQAALFGVLGQIEALGLELLEIRHSHDLCEAASPAPPRTWP